MLDVEIEVFSTVATAIRAQFPSVFVSGEYVAAPSTFPAVTIVEDDNSTYQRTLDTGGEKHSSIMYTVNIYSNKTVGRKSEARSIMALADTKMQELGFIRVGAGPMEMPNASTSIYRMVSRYKAVISKEKVIYRR